MAAEPEDAPEVLPEVAVTVVRTGGVAGLSRRWHAAGDAASGLVDLVERCPWDACDEEAPAAPEGADRFTWSVSAVRGPQERHADLAEHDLDGPWRELIDAVRALARSVATPQE